MFHEVLINLLMLYTFPMSGLEHVRNILRSPHAALRWIVRENVEQARALTSSYNLDTRCETPANAQKAIEDPKSAIRPQSFLDLSTNSHRKYRAGGIFRDSTIHDLDMGGWIIGSRPTSVFAHGHAHKEELKAASDNDQVVVIVTYENGAISVIVNGRWCPFGYDQRLEVLCEKMQLSVENRGANHVVSGTNQGMLQSAPEANFMRRYPEAYANELEHFLDVLEGKESPSMSKFHQ
ncbi:IOLG-like protein [Mya arenaria]|uniref:IOLG-like protein n=1 Tax=Mya arenaria TaxID=6604 RepID=A0ABY7G6C2_MYAAR|nr:IOLG-like protein [Mya arenaria]